MLMSRDGEWQSQLPIGAKPEYRDEDLAIIGIYARLPVADDIDEFWDNLKNGRDCITHLPESRRADVDAYIRYTQNSMLNPEYNLGGYLREIDKFDYDLFRIPPKEASLMDPNQRLFLEAAWGAIEDSGYGGGKLEGSRTGVYTAFRNVSGRDYSKLILTVEPNSIPIAIPGNTSSIIPSRIAYLLDLKGPTVIVDTACSSSLVTLHLACQGIHTGDCDLAIVGGVEINLLPYKESISTMVGIESGDRRTKTFDENAAGTCESEGVAAILIKPVKRALADGDHIYAVIKGSAINQDGRSVGITAPNATAQTDVLVRAWEKAGINPETLSYIEAHGTATKIGDPTEILGLKKAFENYTDKKQFCAIGAVKSNIGHLGALSGLAGVLKVVVALMHKQIPPSINFLRPNRRITYYKSPVYINDILRDWSSEHSPRRCGVSSFGFSGTNCHVVLEEAPVVKDPPESDGTPNMIQVFTVTGKSRRTVEAVLAKYHQFGLTGYQLRDICFTANSGRGQYECRLALILTPRDNLSVQIRNVKESGLENIEEGCFYGEYTIVRTGNNAAGWITEKTKKELTREAELKLDEFIQSGQEDRQLLKLICALYVKGAEVNWAKLYQGEPRKRVRLPVYEFAPTRCWITVPEINEARLEADISKNLRYYGVDWQKAPLCHQAVNGANGTILVLNDTKGLGEKLAVRLREQGHQVVEADSGPEFHKVGEDRFTITGPGDYPRLLEQLAHRNITQIIHLVSLGQGEATDVEGMEAIHQKGLYSLFYLVKALTQHTSNHIDLVLIADHVNCIGQNESSVNPDNAALFGLGKVTGLENPRLRSRCIDVEAEVDAGHLVHEVTSGYHNYLTAYRGGERYVEIIRELDLNSAADHQISIKANGVYLITGGMGGIGIEVCKFLANKNRVILILMNRSPIPPRQDWERIAAGGSTKLSGKLQQLLDIEAAGSRVICRQVDISKREDLQTVLNEVRNEYGKIDGIIHAAGISRGSLLKDQTETEFVSILESKIKGTWLLDHLTQDDKLDFLMLFASAITVIGGVGGGAYTAANSYLDSYAIQRSRNGKRTMVIDWPTWRETGFSEGVKVDESRELFQVIEPEAALGALEKVLAKDITRTIIGPINYNSPILALKEYLPFQLSEAIRAQSGKATQLLNQDRLPEKSGKTVVLEGRASGVYSNTEKLLAQIWGDILGFDHFRTDDNFFEIGGDSITMVRLEVEMKLHHLPAHVEEILKVPVLEELAALLDNKQVAGKSQAKTLAQIEPFCDIFYKSCFYNSFFPVVHHFGKSSYPFLVNGVSFFEYSEQKAGMKYRISYIEAEPFAGLCAKVGLAVEARVSSVNIVDDIISAIEADKPVLIWVDCFYESIRADTYQKEHLPHTWLVYGFNKEHQTFTILEHTQSQNLLYSERAVSFDDTVNSYHGYLTHFDYHEEAPTYLEFGSISNDHTPFTANDLMAMMAQNTIHAKTAIFSGLRDLLKFGEDFKQMVEDPSRLSNNLSELLAVFNEVMNAIKADRYKLSKILGEQAGIDAILDKVYEMWNSIRIELVRFMFYQNYDIKILQQLSNTIPEIYQLESTYYEKLINYLDKYKVNENQGVLS